MIKTKLLTLTLGFIIVGCGERQVEFLEIGGPEGPQGNHGLQGEGCSVLDLGLDFVITCGDSEVVIAKPTNGSDGVDGSDGANGADGNFEGILEYVVVCPNVAGSYPETLINLNGTFLAYFTEANSNWQNKRLAILEENLNYQTSDTRGITFKIVDSKLEYTGSSKVACE